MKTILLSLLLIFTSTSYAQLSKKDHAVYTGLEGELGTYKGGGFNINYIYHKKYSLELQYTFSSRTPTQLPDNYNPGSTLLGKREIPIENLNSAMLLVGRLFTLDDNESFRVNLKTGLSNNSFQIPIDFIPNLSEDDWFSQPRNYYHSTKKVNNYGLVLKPSLEILFNRSIGVSIATFVNFNKEQIIVSGQVGIIFGNLRSKNSSPN